ncbi:MAG: hypothetical protein GTO17_06600 [Candidatus Aminicenantes bacterium]|nr:hypothetical protein [Candidatus Aminicenantes bacterium]
MHPEKKEADELSCSPLEAKESHRRRRADLCCVIPLEKTKKRAGLTIYGLMGKVRF